MKKGIYVWGFVGILICIITFCNVNAKRIQAAEMRLPDRNMTGIQSSMPTRGTVNVLVLAVEFPDKKFDGDIKAALKRNMFEEAGTQWQFKPYDSVTNYYERSSFNKLYLQGDVHTFTASKNRENYAGNQSELINEIFDAYQSEILKNSGNAEDKEEYFNNKLAKYDKNGDHVIDGIYFYCAGGAGGSASSPWWNRTGFYSGYTIGGYSVGSFCLLVDREVNIICHETGHMLGLPDYGEDYEYYKYVSYAPSGIAGNDMMNNRLGDHSSFSKILLGWIDQDDIQVITGESAEVQLSDCAKEGKCVAIVPDYKEDQGLLTKFLLIDYVNYTENNDISRYGISHYQDNKGGLRIYQVDAGLNQTGQFLRDTASYFRNGTAPLIRQIHADAEQEHSSRYCSWYDNGDTIGIFHFISPKKNNSKIDMNGCLFHTGDELTPYSMPSSCLYGEDLWDMKYSGAYVKDIDQKDFVVSFVAGIEEKKQNPPVTCSVDSTTGNTYTALYGPQDQLHFSTEVIPADSTDFRLEDGYYYNTYLSYLQDKKGNKIYYLKISISNAIRGSINIEAEQGREIILKENEEYEIVIPKGTLCDTQGNVLDEYKIDFSTKTKYEKTLDYNFSLNGEYVTVRSIDKNGSGILINFLWADRFIASGKMYVIDDYKIAKEVVCPDELLRAIKYYDNKMWRNKDGTFTITARDTEKQELVCVTFDTLGNVKNSYSLDVERIHNMPYGVINNEKGYILVDRTLYFLNSSSYEKMIVFDDSVIGASLRIAENGTFLVKDSLKQSLDFYDADARLINSIYIGYNKTKLDEIGEGCFIKGSSGYLLSVTEFYDKTYHKCAMWQFDENCRLVKKYIVPVSFGDMIQWEKGFIGECGTNIYLMDFNFHLVDTLKYVTSYLANGSQIQMKPDNNLSVGYYDALTLSNFEIDLLNYDDSTVKNIHKIDDGDKPDEPAGGVIEISSDVMASEYEKETGFKNIKWYNLDGVYIADDTYMEISNEDGSYWEYFYFNVKKTNLNPNIVREHSFGDLKFNNITLYWKDNSSFFECDVTNTGSETFRGTLGFYFYDNHGKKMATISANNKNQVLPGETKKITGKTSSNLTEAVRLEISMEDADISINKRGITQKRTIRDKLQMDDIRLFSNVYDIWTFECTLSLADDTDYEMLDFSELYLTFKSDDETVLLDKVINIKMEDTKEVFLAFYTYKDLTNASFLEIRTTPSILVPEATPPTTPKETTMPSGSATPVPDTKPIPSSVGTQTPIPNKNLTQPTDKSPSSGSKAKMKKLSRPIIRITIKKYKKNIRIAKIRLKKYQGTYIEIYYRRGKGKFKKIKLKQSNIKKNKKVFKVGYKKGSKKIYLRVRTYRKKGGKKVYSLYSKSWRIR